MYFRFLFFIVAALLIGPAQVHAAELTQSTNRPVVVCLGDSITRRGYPEVLETLLRVRAINAGVNGNTSRQGLARLQRDVLSQHPAAVVLFFGANDSRLDAPKTQVGLQEYTTNLTKIVTACQRAGAKVLVGSMPPIVPEPYYTRHPKTNYDAVGGLHKHLTTYRDAARKVALEQHAEFIDLGALLLKEPQWVTEDGVHPDAGGNTVLARLIAERLKSMLKL